MRRVCLCPSMWFLVQVWVDVNVAYDLFPLQLESTVAIISVMKPHVNFDVSSVEFFYLQNNFLLGNWDVMNF